MLQSLNTVIIKDPLFLFQLFINAYVTKQSDENGFVLPHAVEEPLFATVVLAYISTGSSKFEWKRGIHTSDFTYIIILFHLISYSSIQG